MGPEVVFTYADRGFCYALVVYLLWRDKELVSALKHQMSEAIGKLTVAVEKMSTLIETKLK